MTRYIKEEMKENTGAKYKYLSTDHNIPIKKNFFIVIN